MTTKDLISAIKYAMELVLVLYIQLLYYHNLIHTNKGLDTLIEAPETN